VTGATSCPACSRPSERVAELHVHEWGDPGSPFVVCVHGLNAHGRRFRRLAEERLASRFRVLAPDLRGHGSSSWDPPWTIATHVRDLLDTVAARGIERADWIGHSLGGRLVLELAATAPESIDRAVLLDPAIQLLPHVSYDFAERERAELVFESPDEAIRARLDGGSLAPREFLDEEMADHLVKGRDGLWRFRYCQAAAVSLYGELCTPPPDPRTLEARTLLLHSVDFGLVRDEQLEQYAAALGEQLELACVHGGHIIYWDAYADMANLVERFLEDARSQRGCDELDG
jgi:lipase